MQQARRWRYSEIFVYGSKVQAVGFVHSVADEECQKESITVSDLEDWLVYHQKTVDRGKEQWRWNEDSSTVFGLEQLASSQAKISTKAF